MNFERRADDTATLESDPIYSLNRTINLPRNREALCRCVYDAWFYLTKHVHGVIGRIIAVDRKKKGSYAAIASFEAEDLEMCACTVYSDMLLYTSDDALEKIRKHLAGNRDKYIADCNLKRQKVALHVRKQCTALSVGNLDWLCGFAVGLDVNRPFYFQHFHSRIDIICAYILHHRSVEQVQVLLDCVAFMCK